MKIIIDECLPKRINKFFPEHEVWTIPQIKLNGCKDTELQNALHDISSGKIIHIPS